MNIEAMLANGGAGGRYLGENAQVQRYDEGPAEKLERWYKLYEDTVRTCTEKEVGTWVAHVAKTKGSKLGQILNCKETTGYLKDLEEFSPHFMVDALYGQKFCVEFLHAVNGGVSG